MSNLARVANISSRWCVIALGIAIPLSVVLDNLLLLVLLVLILIRNSRDVLHTATHNPVARAGALLFVALLLGVAYGGTPFKEAADILGKYADLAFIPLLMVAGRDAEIRRYAVQGFLAVMLITALLSWLVGLHVLPVAGWMWKGCTPEYPAIFRSSITQNMLMAYTAYLLALQAGEPQTARRKILLIGLAALACGNVLFMVPGRTGYLVLLALGIYFAWVAFARKLRSLGRGLGWREGAGMVLLTLVLVFGVYHVSSRLHDRVDLVLVEFRAWQANGPNGSSTGDRAEFYYNTFELVKRHPLLGVGTGGFPAAYAEQVRGKGVTLTHNPHNEYLLITAQIGLVGLALLLYLFYTQWRHAARLPGLFEQDAARGLVLTIAVTSLFNSPLLDHTEGLFFGFASAILFARSPLSCSPPAGEIDEVSLREFCVKHGKEHG